MNWLDWLVLLVLALAAFKGFQRGFMVELASLVALVLGIWAAVHVSDRVAALLGLDPDNVALAFLVTFLAVLLAVHLLARGLTALVDLAQMGLPNKLVGIFFGVLRSAFSLSVAFNLLVGYSEGTMPPANVREASRFYAPIRAFAPMLVPALGDTKWVRYAVEELKEGVDRITNEHDPVGP
jgi:membrane protein required for colicin V production